MAFVPPKYRRLHSAPRILQGDELPPELSRGRRGVRRAYLWGQLPPRPWVAIVGSRQVSRHGLEVAGRVARTIAATGASVVSGGAIGIDAAAHHAALKADSPTLVVAPTWASRAYPEKNHDLFESILEKGGGYLTTAEEDAAPRGGTFYKRNADLIALVDCVLLGESKVKSGARNTMKHARQQNRHRLVLPVREDCPTTRGAQLEHEAFGLSFYFRIDQLFELLVGPVPSDAEEYAAWRKRVCWQDNAKWMEAVEYWTRHRSDWQAELRPEDARANSGRAGRGLGSQRIGNQRIGSERAGAMPATPGQSVGGERSVLELGDDEIQERVRAALRRGATHTEAIIERCGARPEEVQHQLLLLTLAGEVIEDAQGLWALCRS